MKVEIKNLENELVKAKAFVMNDIENVMNLSLHDDELNYVKETYDVNKDDIIVINRYTELYIIFVVNGDDDCEKLECCRKNGALICNMLNAKKLEEVVLMNEGVEKNEFLATVEGMMLCNYEFKKYKSEPKYNTFKTIYLKDGVDDRSLRLLEVVVDATCWARDLVNEPVNKLNAEELAECVSGRFRDAGGRAEVLNRKKIESLKMGGLLAVNAGSVNEPTFTILEWNPDNKVNEKPIVLVGKGIVFDTGGYNLKPTAYMNDMKDDMSGAATVAAVLFAVAKSKLPLHIVGLIPATDNRIDGNAHVSGDIITMFDGTTVEVVNTDAEGRLILADALSYAKKYDPMLVMDFATLTGAASYAIGPVATVVMENDASDSYNEMEKIGEEVNERLVKFPLWKEYGKLVKSDIADLKNSGGKYAGMITAGKFLQHFTDYPWIHFDIAGTAFIENPEPYRGPGATGIHVRLLMHYFDKLIKTF